MSAAPVPGFLVPLGLDEPCAVEAFWGKLPAAMFSFGFHGALRPSARANARHKRFHTDALVQRLCLLLCEPLWPSCAVLPDSHKAPTFLSFSIGAPKKQIGGSGLLALCSSCHLSLVLWRPPRGAPRLLRSGACTLGLCVVPNCSASGLVPEATHHLLPLPPSCEREILASVALGQEPQLKVGTPFWF